MSRYVLKRFYHSLFVMAAVLTLVFLVGRMIGDPALVALGTEATPESLQRLRANMGLDDPVIVQYLRFVAGAVTGDFGISFWQNVPALPLVIERLPATLFLAACAFATAIPLGILFGAVAAWRPGSIIDRFLNVLSLAGASVVEFWVALMLILVVAVQLGWLPTSGFRGVGWSGLPYVILPAIVLAIRPMGRVAQVSRSAMLDELSRPYAKMARAKGLRERKVVGKHTLKNAMIPTITLAGDSLTGMVNGAIILEVIFAWPGVGLLLIQGVQRRDLPMVEATVFVVAIMVILINLVVDLLYARLNPRIRYDAATS